MFSYEHLLAFCSTYEEQGYSAAAKKLRKDRTTIRDQVKALEDTYNVVLFEIQGKKASPTDAAKHIYHRSKVVIRNTEKLNTSLDTIFCEKQLSLNIYHDISLPLNLAIKIEHALCQQLPELRLHWLHRNRSEAFDGIAKNDNSIALMQNKNIYDVNKSIEFSSIGYGRQGIYTGKRNKLRFLNQLSLEDLKLEKQYLSENHLNTLPDLYAVSPHYHLVSSNDLLIELVKHDGWAFMSSEQAQPLLRSGELVELDINEILNHFQFGLTLFYPMALEQNQSLLTIKRIAKEHFSDKNL